VWVGDLHMVFDIRRSKKSRTLELLDEEIGYKFLAFSKDGLFRTSFLSESDGDCRCSPALLG
jgi:hypothetical protein